MTPRTKPGSAELGGLIRNRREELGLTIEAAARAAGVGSETWRRYEMGASIRRDKVRGLCHALRWRALPDLAGDRAAADDREKADAHRWEDYPKANLKDSYSTWLAEDFGDACARAFAFGCDITHDQMTDDLETLSSHPRGTHLGELDHSWMAGSLPPQWVTRYDYELLYRLRSVVNDLRLRAVRPGWDGSHDFTRSVADDVVLHLIFEQGGASAEALGSKLDEEELYDWEMSLNGEDDETILALYTGTRYIDESSSFHFDRWFHQVYYGRDNDAQPDSADPDDTASKIQKLFGDQDT